MIISVIISMSYNTSSFIKFVSNTNDNKTTEQIPLEDMKRSVEDNESQTSTDLDTIVSANLSPNTGLNLDVTAMLAYISNLTNGHCNALFAEPVLTQQAVWERHAPVKYTLDLLFSGKQLVCCRSAERAFLSIVNTMGGPNEQMRAQQLLKRVHVVEDMTVSAIAILEGRGKVHGNSEAVFGTGETLRLPTVTANINFIRAAAEQGVILTTFTHGPRALTEAKELSSRITKHSSFTDS
jgi:hypothetical protein